MMPLPFIKVTAKEFKRNLWNDDSDSDTSSNSSTTTTSSGSSSSTSKKSIDDVYGSDRASKSLAIKNLQSKDYTVPIIPVDEASASHTGKYSPKITRSSILSSMSATSSTASSGSTTLRDSSNSSASQLSGSKSDRSTVATVKEAASSSSSFSLHIHIDPADVVDPKTGKNIYATATREMKIITVRKVHPTSSHRSDATEPEAPPQGPTATAMSTGMANARSSLAGSKAMQSTAVGLEKVKQAAKLTIKIGEVIMAKGLVTPLTRKVAHEWKSFNGFRERHRTERRSKTLDWFEHRVEAKRRKEELEKQQLRDQHRRSRRADKKAERTAQQRKDFLHETRVGFKEKADLNLTKSIEKEKVRDFFLENNDGWQMHTLTRNVNEDEKRRQQMEDDEKTALIRDGDERRQAAADEYLAEYDRGEILTQATLRIMRRSGIIAGINAPPVAIEDPPLETDPYLLLRLKQKSREVGTAAEEVKGAKAIPKASGPPAPGGKNPRNKITPVPSPGNDETYKDPPPETKRTPPPPSKISSVKSPDPQKRATTAGENIPPIPTIEKPAPPISATTTTTTTTTTAASRDGGNKSGKGGQKRGKKRSSGAFEVDLLHFRSVEEIRGWKLGALGGESLAADFSNGACPRLVVLRLGWCFLGDGGTRAIVRALSNGGGASAAGRTIQELDLRGNAITAGGGRAVGDALAFGAFPALRGLDLGANALRDDGGRSIAHHLLAGQGTWPRLARLDLSCNGMGDGGVEAVYKAVTAPGVSLAHDVETISLRNNFASREARERTSRCPYFLLM